MIHYILSLVLAFFIHPTYSARILVVPLPHKSHTLYMNSVAEELPARGHEVYTVQPAYLDEPTHFTKLGFKVLKYPIPEGGMSLNSEEVRREEMEMLMAPPSMENMKYLSIAMYKECEYVLDESFTSRLKSLNFDIALIDGMPFVPCLFLIPHVLQIPFVNVFAYAPWFSSRVPLLPSFVPNILLASTDVMTFKERVLNFVFTVIIESEIVNPFPVAADMLRLLHKYANDTSITKWGHLISKSSLYFIERGPLLDWPAPSMPNIFYLEGLTSRPAKQLTKEINDLVDEASAGFIVVSFGSRFDKLPHHVVKIFMEAFQQRPELVLFRLTLDSSESDLIPDNVKLMSWLPQNDLFAHPNAKLFITHCGNFGQYEALYHGIPMIGFPLGGDQPRNAARVVAHGYGVSGNFFSLTSHELLAKINEVVSNKTYKDNIVKASQIMRSQPMNARETAAYWIEHVLEFGDGHLRSHAIDMPLYQYLMLDILAVVIFVLCVELITIYCLVKKLANFPFREGLATKLKTS